MSVQPRVAVPCTPRACPSRLNLRFIELQRAKSMLLRVAVNYRQSTVTG